MRDQRRGARLAPMTKPITITGANTQNQYQYPVPNTHSVAMGYSV